MAERGGFKLSLIRCFCQCIRRPEIIHGYTTDQLRVDCRYTADVADWTDGRGKRSHQKRSNIVYAIMYNYRKDHLRKILDSGWDVNEILDVTIYGNTRTTTALHVASQMGWTEGLKMLFDAGADYMRTDERETILLLALDSSNCSFGLIDLLLKNAAAPNPFPRNQIPRGLFYSLPLGRAIQNIEYDNNFTDIVHLLLKNGADPNATASVRQYRYEEPDFYHEVEYVIKKCPLSECLILLDRLASKRLDPDVIQDLNVTDVVTELVEENAALVNLLVHFGANVNWDIKYTEPLLHRMVNFLTKRHHVSGSIALFLQEHLDIFYQNRGNINMEYGDYGTALEYAVRELAHNNSVRWLIRHGAEIKPLTLSLLKGHFKQSYFFGSLKRHRQLDRTLLILLQAGLRVSHGASVHLMNMEEEMSTCQAQGLAHGDMEKWIYAIIDRVDAITARLEKKEKQVFLKLGTQSKKWTSPEHLSRQMADLEEFSDESLLVYPENSPGNCQTETVLTSTLDKICKVLEFLSQPQSLQWYCRRCVRENLVSLQPSVVKMLPGPSRLKRYILCHEI